MTQVEGAPNAVISQYAVEFCFSDGTAISTRPYIMCLLVALLGQDVLSQMGAKITTNSFQQRP